MARFTDGIRYCNSHLSVREGDSGTVTECGCEVRKHGG